MKFTVAVLLLGAIIATQAHYLPSSHHGHHGSKDLDHGKDYLWDNSHAEEPLKWTGPIHVPVIKNGVPTETPEVRHAKAHIEHKFSEAKSHPGYQVIEEENREDGEQDKWSHHESHQQNYGGHHQSRWTGPTEVEVRHAKTHHTSKHAGHVAWNREEHSEDNHHGEHRWTGPVHVPVIEHGVPTETPEVRHAKAYLEHKLAEAKSHPGYQSKEEENHDEEQQDKWSHHESHQQNHGDHHQFRWTGPIHNPVIVHGVPTETPEVRHAKAYLEHKLAEAKTHPDYQSKEENHNEEQQDKWAHHENHQQNHGGHHLSRWTVIVHETPKVRHAKTHHTSKHAGHVAWNREEHSQDNHHGEHRWTGPIHVPVIEHGVPTETPEVRHAKANLLKKFAEAKTHHDSHHFEDVHSKPSAESHRHFSHEASHHVGHSGGHRWTGPIHEPVIEHGVPTETPEVKHAKAHLHAKLAEAKLHPEFDADCEDNKVFASHGNDHHQHLSHNDVFHNDASHHGHEKHQRWTGPIHVPVLHHGVPTETPEVQEARAQHQHKLAEARRHPHFNDEEAHHAALFVEAKNKGQKAHHWKSSHSHGAHKLSHY